MIKYVLRNVVNDQLIDFEMFDTMVNAFKFRAKHYEDGTAWVDQVEVQKCTNPDLILDSSKPAYIVRTV